MKNEKRASTADTVKGSRKAERPVRCAHLYCITWLMVFATVASAWHIDGVWDGVATLITGLITIALFERLVMEADYDWQADS